MTSEEAKRHLLNHMQYSYVYLRHAQADLSEIDPVRLCEYASHAMACMWALVDALLQGELDPRDLAEAMEAVATRWMHSCEKWSRALPSNRAAAYIAPIKERRAVQQWPMSSSSGSTAGLPVPADTTTSSTRAGDGTSTAIDLSSRPASSTGASGATNPRGRPAQSQTRRPRG